MSHGLAPRHSDSKQCQNFEHLNERNGCRKGTQPREAVQINTDLSVLLVVGRHDGDDGRGIVRLAAAWVKAEVPRQQARLVPGGLDYPGRASAGVHAAAVRGFDDQARERVRVARLQCIAPAALQCSSRASSETLYGQAAFCFFGVVFMSCSKLA